MTDTIIQHQGHEIRMVPVIEVGFCAGCIYEEERSEVCPKNEQGTTICYTEEGADFIFIENTPEAIAKYIEHRIDPTHEDDQDDNDHLYT